jgi:sugar phosphate isomerase/epimerase
MKISCCFLYAISKYGYPPSVSDMHRALQEMHGLGFQYVELEGMKENHLKEVYAQRAELKRRGDDLSLRVINFCPVLPALVSMNPAERRHAIDLFKTGIELANYFGCDTIQIDSYTPPLEFLGEAPYKEMISFGRQFKVRIPDDFQWQSQWEALVDSVVRCTALAKQAGLRLCLEPRVGEIISNTDAMLRLLDAVNDENFGAVLDTGHQHAQKELLPLSVEKLGKRIFYLHVSDNDGRENKHLRLGEGTIDWEGLFLVLKRHGYEGYVAIDVGNVPNLDEAYRESKRYLEELAGRVDFL